MVLSLVGVMQENEIPPLPSTGVTLQLVPGLTGYAVGADGSFWSCRCPSRSRRFKYKGWEKRAPTKHPDTGYMVVSVKDSKGNKRQHRLHRLMLLSFVGPPARGQIALHWDDNKDNNCLSNLRWGSHMDNRADCIRNGTACHAQKGTSHHMAKLCDDDVRLMRSMRQQGITYEALGIRFSVSMTVAWRICNGKNWTHVV